MMHLNVLLAALFVASAVSAPVHTDVVPSLPSPQISTPAATTVALPVSRSVPSSVWQHNRRVVDYDAVPLSTPAGLPVGPPSPNGDKPLNIRAATHSVGAVTTVTLPLPTATTPIPHVHRADGETGCDDAEADSDDEKRDLHARMLALPIKGLGRPHATTTLNSIKARQLFMPTALFNAALVPKATAA